MQLTSFQHLFFDALGFQPKETDFSITYSNPNKPELGCITYHNKDNAYLLVIGNYAIPQDFDLKFEIHHCQLRFGIVYDGISTYHIKDQTFQKFYPSAFIAKEENLRGHQKWLKNTHYYGIEIFIQGEYLNNTLTKNYPELNDLTMLGKNSPALYLPFEVIDTLKSLEKHSKEGTLSPLLLESKILECLAYITMDLKNNTSQLLQLAPTAEKINLLKNGYKGFSASDINTLRHAKNLLTEQIINPPTIHALSDMLHISEQKLTKGFKTLYNTTIGGYIKDLRLQTAANLLTLTELSIEEVAYQSGYSHPSNLGKAFKTKYHQSPLHFRKRSHR